MSEGRGKHADTRPGNDTGAPRGCEVQLFLAAATLRNPLALSGDMPVAWGSICLMPIVSAFGKPVRMPRTPLCQRHTPVSERGMPGQTA